MKKNLLKLMALTFALTLSLSVAGCGTKDNSANEPSNSATGNEASNSTTDEKEPEDTKADEGSKLEEYLAQPEVQSLAESLSSDEYKVEMLAVDGNILVYRYTYNEQLDLSDESIKDTMVSAMDEMLDAQSSAFTDVADSLESELGMDNIVVRVEYLNADGSEILVKDFK